LAASDGSFLGCVKDCASLRCGSAAVCYRHEEGERCACGGVDGAHCVGDAYCEADTGECICPDGAVTVRDLSAKFVECASDCGGKECGEELLCIATGDKRDCRCSGARKDLCFGEGTFCAPDGSCVCDSARVAHRNSDDEFLACLEDCGGVRCGSRASCYDEESGRVCRCRAGDKDFCIGHGRCTDEGKCKCNNPQNGIYSPDNILLECDLIGFCGTGYCAPDAKCYHMRDDAEGRRVLDCRCDNAERNLCFGENNTCTGSYSCVNGNCEEHSSRASELVMVNGTKTYKPGCVERCGGNYPCDEIVSLCVVDGDERNCRCIDETGDVCPPKGYYCDVWRCLKNHCISGENNTIGCGDAKCDPAKGCYCGDLHNTGDLKAAKSCMESPGKEHAGMAGRHFYSCGGVEGTWKDKPINYCTCKEGYTPQYEYTKTILPGVGVKVTKEFKGCGWGPCFGAQECPVGAECMWYKDNPSAKSCRCWGREGKTCIGKDSVCDKTECIECKGDRVMQDANGHCRMCAWPPIDAVGDDPNKCEQWLPTFVE